MSQRERILRCKRTLTKPKRRKSTSNNIVRYSINYQSLMSGEGGKEISTRSRKIIRVGTVLAYIIVVSLGAIVLSLYYCYMWVPYYLTNSTESENVAPKTGCT